jgi:hypothetical protein
MTSDFLMNVELTVGPLLKKLGLVLDEVDDTPDGGGIERQIAYYHSPDCKIQIYWSSREGEINAMIGPLDAPNECGLQDRSRK